MLSCKQTSGQQTEKLLHQIGDLFELNIKFRCRKVKATVTSVHILSNPVLADHYNIQRLVVEDTSYQHRYVSQLIIPP
jgi:hypothetical protein